MSGWWRDIQYGARMIARHPGPSALAVVALALGIGLTTTMFSIVQGAILRGLPFEGGDKIHYLTTRTPSSTERGEPVSYHDLVDWRRQQQSFESLEGYLPSLITVTGSSGFPERLRGVRVTPGLFHALRVSPILGRDFTDADAEPGAPRVIIIGHLVWETRFQAREDAIGQVLNIDGTPATVIGVMPAKFGFPQAHNAWMPLSVTLAPKRGTGGRINVIGRLKDDVTLARARLEMDTIAAQLASQFPENKDVRAAVEPYAQAMLGTEIVSTLLTMLAAVFGVMLIACVNVTNLQLARAADRTREVAIRVAIGAGRWQIVRQTLVEGLMLSTGGALLGLALAWTGADLFSRAIVDTNPPFWIDVRLDPVVLAFVTAITVAAALVSSLVPGWRLARADVNDALKDEGRGTTSLRMGRFARSLVVVEVTVSCILLVVSGLMIRSIVKNSQLTYPFATEDVFYGTAQLEQRTFQDDTAVAAALALVEQRLAVLPGARAVGLGTGIPRSIGLGQRLEVDGQTYDSDDDHPRPQSTSVSSRYFDVLRVQPIMGRVFTEGDTETALPVGVVDEMFARQYLPDGAIGRRVRTGRSTESGLSFDGSPWITIVGVVPSLANTNDVRSATPVLYRPLAQEPARSFLVLISTSGEPTALSTEVRTTLAGIGEGTPIQNINSLADNLWQQGWASRVFGGLFVTFGLAALVLASAGLYGVLAFGVRQRTQEIGVRMAMGADRSRVLRMILWQGMWRVSIAVAVGLVPGWLVGGLMSGLLSDVSPADPLVHTTTAVTLLLSGVAASLAPALRAASVDPIKALRGEG